MPKTLSQSEIFQLILRLSIASVVTYYSMKWMLDRLDPTYKSKKKARDKAEQQIKRLVTNYIIDIYAESMTMTY